MSGYDVSFFQPHQDWYEHILFKNEVHPVIENKKMKIKKIKKEKYERTTMSKSLLQKKFFKNLLRDLEEFTYQYVWNRYGFMDEEELHDNCLEFIDQYFGNEKILSEMTILKYVSLIGSKKILKCCIETESVSLRGGLMSFIQENTGPQHICSERGFIDWIKINV